MALDYRYYAEIPTPLYHLFFFVINKAIIICNLIHSYAYARTCTMDHVYMKAMKSFYTYLANLPLLVLLLLLMMTTSKSTLAASLTSSLATFLEMTGGCMATLGSNLML